MAKANPMKRVYFILFVPIALMWVSCEKPDVSISDIPEIELLNAGPLIVEAFKDSVVFEIKYTDGNGDLGTNDDTQRNVFVTDSRIDVTHEFRVQQLAPDGANIAITGTFFIHLPNTLLTGGNTEEKVKFSIYVVDEAGNESNTVESPEITVLP